VDLSKLNSRVEEIEAINDKNLLGNSNFSYDERVFNLNFSESSSSVYSRLQGASTAAQAFNRLAVEKTRLLLQISRLQEIKKILGAEQKHMYGRVFDVLETCEWFTSAINSILPQSLLSADAKNEVYTAVKAFFIESDCDLPKTMEYIKLYVQYSKEGVLRPYRSRYSGVNPKTDFYTF